MVPTIIFPSMNPELCAFARAFIPPEWPVIVKDGNPERHFDELKTLDIQTKWAVNVDEDCFVINPQAIVELIAHMEASGYDTAAIQDGASNLRAHNPVMFNPFFFVFNVAKVQAVPKVTTDIPTMVATSRQFAPLQRYFDLPFEFDGFEPYYPFFTDLLLAGLRPLFLNNHAWEAFDPAPTGLGKPSIVLDERGNELCIHAWYSRLYHEPVVRARLDACIRYAYDQRRKLLGLPPA
ncbi:hypothetical protein [Duganella callida]|uniref:Glycosyltransferase family 2 protein n=1 Tax=Duganella callida TaxID=2561932 RepID=A0A4Y9T0G4_9BURK|nr:hypothetical protein [Duganella callida]TFW30393.1 hypothetical protein E4L98_02480 [Duganella callida]